MYVNRCSVKGDTKVKLLVNWDKWHKHMNKCSYIVAIEVVCVLFKLKGNP